MRKRRIITTNRDIYRKLNMLSFNTEVVIKGIESKHISRIVNNINKYNKVVCVERFGDYFLLKKMGPINYDVYFKEK